MPPRLSPIARPKHNFNRLSAVYIGPNPSAAAAHYPSASPLSFISPPIEYDSIPDLPEPPSPNGSDTGSGLPSPPATNSTGSTDDHPHTLDSPDQSFSSKSSSNNSSGTVSGLGGTAFSPRELASSSAMRRSSSASKNLHRTSISLSNVAGGASRSGRFEDGYSRPASASDTPGDLAYSLPHVHQNGAVEGNTPLHSDEEDGDDTARFDLGRSIAETTNQVLRRAKSLTQRNRLTLDRLASIPRTGSDQRSPASATSRSPAPSHASLPEASTSSPSTSRPSHSRGLSNVSAATTFTRSARSTPSLPPLSRHPTAPDPDHSQDIDPAYRSGSETERESTSSFRSRPSSAASYTRPTASTIARANARSPPPSIKKRVPSVPSSPLLQAVTDANTSQNARSAARGDHDQDVPSTSTAGGSTSTARSTSTGSGSDSASNSSRRKKRVSLALTTPSKLGYTSVEPGEEDESYDRQPHVNEFGEREKGNMGKRSSLSLTAPPEDRRRDRARVWDRDRDKDRDVEREPATPAPFGASASSRRGAANGIVDSGGSIGRKRSALPAEFIRGSSGDEHPSSPVTPYRPIGMVFTTSNSSSGTSASGGTYSSASASASRSQGSGSNSGAGSSRAGSSLGVASRTAAIRRESRQKWASEDFTANASTLANTFTRDHRLTMTEGRRRVVDDRRYADSLRSGDHARRFGMDEPLLRMGEYRERRQSIRGGSAESALALTPGRRSLVAEEFRAAGLGGGGGVGGSGGGGKVQRYSLDDGVGRGDSGPVAWPRSGGGNGWESDEDVPEGNVRRTRTGTFVRPRPGEVPRAATSMADYRYDEGEEGDRVWRDRAFRRTRSPYVVSPRKKDRASSLTRERGEAMEADRSASSMSRYGTLRSHGHRDVQEAERLSTPGERRAAGLSSNGSQGAVVLQREREHIKLLGDSLTMFEGQLDRLGGGTDGELLRNAETVVSAAERLNNMLRQGMTCAVEEQVNAEVEDHHGRGVEMADVWGRVGGEYRDGLRVSDELIRSMTAFLLGVGKVVRDLGAGSLNGEAQHGRSVSLGEEELRGGRKWGMKSPDVFVNPTGPASSAGSGSGRRSAQSRRSWDPREAVGDDLSRRLSARADSVLAHARPSLSGREYREGRYDTPPPADMSSRGSGSTSSSQPRRLYREPREPKTPGGPMRTIHSQEPLDDFEPSPTPAPRAQSQQHQQDRNAISPPLTIPKPLPTLPSEGFLRRNHLTQTPASSGSAETSRDRDRDRDRRKASINSIQTIRGSVVNPPASLTTPSNVTTAITTTTVSTLSPVELPSPHRTESGHALRSEAVTFSRSSTVSVNALNGLQQKDERRRTGSNGSVGAEPSTSVPVKHGFSGSETERESRRRTIGVRIGRASMDADTAAKAFSSSTVHAADRSAAFSARTASGHLVSSMSTTKRERRRTVTDIWPTE